MGSLVPSATFPAPSRPADGPDPVLPGFIDQDSFAESGRHAVVPIVAVAVADPALCDLLAAMVQRAGRVVGGDDVIPVAAVVVADASAGAKPAVAALRARARSDAAIIVVLAFSAPASEVDAAYEAGAVLCLRAPVDERQLLGAVGSAIDLRTAKVQADGLMRQLDLQAHLASIGRVTAGFTHEVSNPLGVLCANFEVLREDIETLLQARDLLAVAIKQCAPSPMKTLAGENLARIASPDDVRGGLSDMGASIDRIKAVLVQARDLAQAGHASRIEDVDLAKVVNDVRRWAASELRGVDVQELIEGAIVARADSRLLGQIVLNLVANAAHSARRLPSPRVRLHVYESGDAAILSVRDNGPGVPQEIRDRIFEPFFTTRRGQGGTGWASPSAESTQPRCRPRSPCGRRQVAAHASASTCDGGRGEFAATAWCREHSN